MRRKSPGLVLILTLLLILLVLLGCSISPAPTSPPPKPTSPSPAPTSPPPKPTSSPPKPTSPPPTTATAFPLPTETTAPVAPTVQAAGPTAAPATDPFTLVSLESLLAYTEDLTAIQPYSGWRNSAGQGETEALDYVTTKLGEMDYLQKLGLELERQSFHVYLGVEIWETRLHLTSNGQEVEVPADAMRGHRDDIDVALRFDSDRQLNDAERNPLVADGPVVLIRSAGEIDALSTTDLEGKVVFLDYAVVDGVVQGWSGAVGAASNLLAKRPAGVVLVTQFSNQIGESHGAFVGDGSTFKYVEVEPVPPILYARLEDLGPAGVTSWEELGQIESARLSMDVDVFSPATSGNLVARIPGADPSRAIILSAHIDSPNSPGAMDDGSGSAILLEIARVLDEAHYQPAADLYLVWYGSEELGLYGASHFVATHQELLDRSLAMLQIDCLTRPLDGINNAELSFVTWSYSRVGDSRLLWTDYLMKIARAHGLHSIALDRHFNYSDNGPFAAYGLPHADLLYMNEQAMDATGSWHYGGHVHDPYDTIELSREMGDALKQMAQAALAAALDTAAEAPNLRVAPQPTRRAVFVASHTEAVHMTPSYFTELGMALSLEGLDVDLIPYGQPVTPADLEGSALVVVLPVLDYPSIEGDVDLYDEAWSEAEIAALESYVAEGGLLLLTNSAHRLKYYNRVLDPNEDWSDANALAEHFGISYQAGTLYSDSAYTEGSHPLVEGLSTLELGDGNGVPFTMDEGQVLARASGEPVLALVDYGDAGGQVLVLADVGLLGTIGDASNIPFWKSLGRYAIAHDTDFSRISRIE